MNILKINLTHWSFLFLALTTQTIRPEMVLDETFGVDGIVRGLGESQCTALIQSNEKFIVAHYFHHTNRFEIVRYNQNGSRDATFGPHVTGEGLVKSLVAQQNNKFIAAVEINGPVPQSFLYRYNTDGSRDASFAAEHNQSLTASLVLQQDEKVIAAGGRLQDHILFTSLARYNIDGSLDESFRIPIIQGSFASLHLQPDGKIVAAGTSGYYPMIARYNIDGSIDGESFGFGGCHILAIQGTFNSLALQPPTNKLIVVGTSADQDNYLIARYNTDGALDTSFGLNGTGVLVVEGLGSHPIIKVQPTGKILVLTSPIIDGIARAMVACYNPNGTPDITFGPDGTSSILPLPHNSYGSAFLFDSETQTLTIAGDETLPDGTMQALLLRYRTLSPVEVEARRVVARLEAEVHNLMRIELEREQCAICLEEDAIIDLVATECRHLFHPACMTSWRNSRGAGAQTCPMCRAALPAQQPQ